MKYTVRAVNRWADDAHDNEVSIRSDASLRTQYLRFARAAASSIYRDGATAERSYEYGIDLPNVWRNGCVGAIWLTMGGEFYDVQVTRADNGCVYVH